jgi:hypothetical protein
MSKPFYTNWPIYLILLDMFFSWSIRLISMFEELFHVVTFNLFHERSVQMLLIGKHAIWGIDIYQKYNPSQTKGDVK